MRHIVTPYLYNRRQMRRAGYSTNRLKDQYVGPLVYDSETGEYWYGTERKDYEGVAREEAQA